MPYCPNPNCPWYYKKPLSVIKQEKWRRKQIYVYYESGRPLFGSFKNY